MDDLIAKDASSETLGRFLEDFRRAVLMQRKALFNIMFRLQFPQAAAPFYEDPDLECLASLDFQGWLREPPCAEVVANRFYRRLLAAQTLLVRRAGSVMEHFGAGALQAEHFADLLRAAHAFEQLADRLAAGITSSITDVDELTGLLNRTAMERDLARATAQARRSGLPITIAMVDADHFKKVNDDHGHAFGDFVLETLAAIEQADAALYRAKEDGRNRVVLADNSSDQPAAKNFGKIAS